MAKHRMKIASAPSPVHRSSHWESSCGILHKATKIKALHKFGGKQLPGLFKGYVQQAGGGWIGDIMVLDYGEIQDAETIHNIGKERRVSIKEITLEKHGDDFCFPCATGELQQPRGS